MKNGIKVLAGALLFTLLVLNPLRANLLSSVATHFPLSHEDKAMLFYQASEIDSCNVDVLSALGDAYNAMKNPSMAAYSFGKAMICSPGNSVMRFKYGAMLFSMGYDGTENIKESIKLEPNNPVYNYNYARITTHQ